MRWVYMSSFLLFILIISSPFVAVGAACPPGDADFDSVPNSVEDVNYSFDCDDDDTDADGIPNYLDTDDDSDGVLTIDEDVNSDGDSTNDDTDEDSVPNYLDWDDDNDFLDTINELALNTDHIDDDSDDDGLLDGTEDSNNNGVVDTGETNPLLEDTDGDGLLDGLETGLTAPEGNHTDLSIFVADADPSTTTNPTDADTDNDGLLDGAEDTNRNGQVDAGETDPLVGDVSPPPPEFTCVDVTKNAIAAAHDYQFALRRVAGQCGRKQSLDCDDRLAILLDAFEVLQDNSADVLLYCAPTLP